MGIFYVSIQWLSCLLKNRKIGGALVTFGVQDIEGSYKDCVKCFEKEQFTYCKVPTEVVVIDQLTQYPDGIHQDVNFLKNKRRNQGSHKREGGSITS